MKHSRTSLYPGVSLREENANLRRQNTELARQLTKALEIIATRKGGGI